MRYALATLLALAIGSQAEAQLIRRYARPAYYDPNSTASYSISPSYTIPGVVVTTGYQTPYTWSTGSTFPSVYYGPTWYSNHAYTNSSGNYYYRSPIRRGWRW